MPKPQTGVFKTNNNTEEDHLNIWEVAALIGYNAKIQETCAE